MKYSIAESARKVGLTRKTLYKHIKKKPISVEKDDNGNPQIDASELIRVYGDRFRPEEGTPKETGQGGIPSTEVAKADNQAEIDLAILKERVRHLEEQRDQFKDLYEHERTERQNSTKLLTDQREKQNQWELSLEQLKQQMLEREQGASKELEDFKRETKRRLIAYKRALQKERDKTFWERLFKSKRAHR